MGRTEILFVRGISGGSLVVGARDWVGELGWRLGWYAGRSCGGACGIVDIVFVGLAVATERKLRRMVDRDERHLTLFIFGPADRSPDGTSRSRERELYGCLYASIHKIARVWYQQPHIASRI